MEIWKSQIVPFLLLNIDIFDNTGTFVYNVPLTIFTSNPDIWLISLWYLLTCQGVNPDVRYEVQYSSYVNVTADGFVVLKRVVKTESFALQVTLN